ncbi:MAG: hypothetical protein ACFE7R_01690 [Candidatus Hodarchaeota archaeon]
MISTQIGTIQDVRERARKALTEYLTMFLPGSWVEPLAKMKLLLQTGSDIDWEALKGHALLYFDEKRLSKDRVECLARVERLGDTFRDVHRTLSPAEWHKAIDDIAHAVNFRVSKAALNSRTIQLPEEKITPVSKKVPRKS